MPKDLPTRYRAGVEFTGADAEALSLFCEKHGRPRAGGLGAGDLGLP